MSGGSVMLHTSGVESITLEGRMDDDHVAEGTLMAESIVRWLDAEVSCFRPTEMLAFN